MSTSPSTAASSSSATSASSISKRQTNYTRLSRLLIDIGRCALQDVFDSIHTPARLGRVLSSSVVQSKLRSLQARRVLHSFQWVKLYPPPGSTAKSSDFDISLLYILLRNICSLPPPTTGWDKEPSSTDKSRAADIVRIKMCRNNLIAHSTEVALEDKDFNKSWIEIQDVLIRLGGSKYQERIQQLLNDSIDHECENHYLSILRSWEEREDLLLGELRQMTLSGEVPIHSAIKMITAGGMVVAFTAGSAFFLNRYRDDPETVIHLVQGAIIPATVATGLAVNAILQGSIVIMVQTSTLEALDALWESYWNGDLRQGLHKVIITEELMKLAPRYAENVMIEVTITEEDYTLARDYLIGKTIPEVVKKEIKGEGQSDDESDSGKNYYGKEVTLYHYTTEGGADGIRRDKKVKQNHTSSGPRSKYTRHGSGIYFTRWDPETHRTRDLIQNNFCNAGKRLRDETKFYDRMQYVVKITFGERDPIEEITERYSSRDLFVHRGDIDLTKYVGRYRIYKNPKAHSLVISNPPRHQSINPSITQ